MKWESNGPLFISIPLSFQLLLLLLLLFFSISVFVSLPLLYPQRPVWIPRKSPDFPRKRKNKMVMSNASYEECRRQRLEENKKRMEDLNLNKLSQSLKASTSPKPSPMKQSKPRTLRQPADLSAVRRSNRVADKPPPNYREQLALFEVVERPLRRGFSKRRDLSNRVYASDEARRYAIERAEDLEAGLESEFPSFLKPMLQSHVTGGFWLGLPGHFCRKNLSKRDEFITLIDEDGNESETKYLAQKAGLSGGWRGFAIDHALVDGDALVFQLIKPTKFKVYIIRANESEDAEEENGNEEASDVTHLDISAKRKKEENADEEASDVTHLDISAKRIRASRKRT